MDAVFLKTANPVSGRCLGASLVPLTVGHLWLLRRHCPDIFTGDDLPFGPLAVATFVCSHDQSQVERLLRRCGVLLTFRIWGWLVRRLDLEIERERFLAYLRHHLEPPKVWRTLGGEGDAPQSPIEHRMLVMLMTELRYPESEALAMPTVKANALWAALSEFRGKCTFENDRISGLFKFAEAHRAKRQSAEN